MAIKPITTFEGDPWKKQKEESDRAHHYFKQYKTKLLSKHKFIQLILEEADQRTAKGRVIFWGTDKTFNEQHQEEIQLYIDTDGKQGQCPKPCSAIKDWFDLHKWFSRRKDYLEMLDEESDVNVAAMWTQFKEELAIGLFQCMKNTVELRQELKEEDRLTLSQDESGAKSVNTDINSIKSISNDDVQKVDVNADVEAKAEVETKADIAQDIILKPEYVELTRKLLEDVVNDS